MIGDIIRWWVVVELLGLVALPLAYALFRRLPDRGHSFARPLGILLVSYAGWLLAMLGLGSFSFPALVVIALAVAGLGWYTLRRVGLSLPGVVRDNLPAVLFQEALFVLMLAAGLLLRWRGIYGAQINHTETPMDYAFLNAILASREFPPQDPWLAQYPINYYYFGYVMVAAVTRLSALPTEVAFNLAAATIYALTAGGVAGIVWNLIGLARHGLSAGDAGEPGTGRPRPAIGGQLLASLVAVLLVLVAGNQVAALQWLTRSERVVALRGGEVVAALTAPRSAEGIRLPRPLPAMPWEQNWGGQQILPAAASGRDAVSSWWPSRAVWDDLYDASGQLYRTYTITEFPFFSFVLGDLHPHVLALPWTLLAVALALNLHTRPRAPEWTRSSPGRIELFVTALVLGGLYAINSWDFPTYLLLYLGSLLLLYLRLAPRPGRIVWPHLLQQAGLLLVACWVVWLPFHMSFVSLVGGNGSPLGISPVHTPLMQFIVVFGLFAVPLIAYLLSQSPALPGIRVPGALLAAAVGLGLILVGVAFNFALLFLMPLAYYAILLAYRRMEQPADAFALWALALGALVVFGTEIVYLRDVFEGQTPRMNTLFKFYYQVWLLWGTLSGYGLWVLSRRPRPATVLWLVPFGLLLAGSLVYPLVIPARQGPDRTLDGIAYVRRERPADAAAIEWIRQNTPGDAVVLQAPLVDSYNPAHAGIATATGRPTLIGWRGHQDQWRGGQPEVQAVLSQRVDDAATIYTTTDTELARELLDKYGVDYVYVGPQEQGFVAERGAPADALGKFEGFMDVAWRGEGGVIYRRR